MDEDNQKEILFVYRISDKLLSRLIGKCPLYRITNGLFGKPKSWREQEVKLPYTAKYFYKNTASEDILKINSNLPVVIYKNANSQKVLLKKEQIEDCNDSAFCIMAKIQQAIGPDL